MTANKNNSNPSERKIHQTDNYKSPSVTGLEYHNRSPIDNSESPNGDPMSDESLDHLIQAPANNDFYQHAPEIPGKKTTSGINPDELVYNGHITHPARQEKTYQ